MIAQKVGRHAGILLFVCLGVVASGQTPVRSAAAGPDSRTSDAEKPILADPLNRTTPQSSVVAFLDAWRSKNFDRAARYLDLRNLPREKRQQDGAALAQQLGATLERDPQFDVASLSQEPEGEQNDGLPPDRDRVATFAAGGGNIDLQLVHRELRSKVAVWVFSQESIALIPRLNQATSSSFVERNLPPVLVQWKAFGAPLWSWIAIALLIVIAAAAAWLLRRVTLTIAERGLKRFSFAPRLLEALGPPFQLLLAAGVFRVGMEALDLSANVHLYLERGLALVSMIAIVLLCVAALNGVVQHFRPRLELGHKSFTRSVLPLATRIAKLVILALGIMGLLSSWGYNTSTILAGLGIGGIALALAAQKTIENLFGGVAVISDQPVHVGDYCKFGGQAGTVEEIGVRSTRIRTADRTVVTVPNGEFSAMTLENFSRRDKMLFHVTLNLRQDATPEQMREILASIEKILRGNPKIEPGDVPVRFIGVGTYSFDVEIFVYIKTQNDTEFTRTKQELLLRILDAVEEAGTALALPTQASVTYSPSGRTPAAPEPDPAWSRH